MFTVPMVYRFTQVQSPIISLLAWDVCVSGSAQSVEKQEYTSHWETSQWTFIEICSLHIICVPSKQQCKVEMCDTSNVFSVSIASVHPCTTHCTKNDDDYGQEWKQSFPSTASRTISTTLTQVNVELRWFIPKLTLIWSLILQAGNHCNPWISVAYQIILSA